MPNVFEKAIQENNFDDVHSYISCGKKIPVDICNEKSQTGLMIACEYKAANCVEEFIDNNANIEATDTSGWRPIHFSAQSGCLEIVKMLIDAGAKIDAENNEGHTALHIAAKHNFADIVDCLLVNKPNENEKFAIPLRISMWENNVEVAKCICSHIKSRFNNKDKKFFNIINSYSRRTAVEIAEELLCVIEDYGSFLGKPAELFFLWETSTLHY